MVKFKKVSKKYGSRQVLKSIDLDLPPAQTHVMLGSSGSGKSTILRILLGLIRADIGHVEIDGKIVSPQDIREWAHRIGYVPQEGGLFPHLTAAENVQLVAKTLGWQESKLKERLEELLGLVGLERGLLSRYPKEMSGGQRQRVSLMRALFLDPQLMVLDEPLGALDPIIRSDLQTELKNIFQKLKKTVILVTHDIGEAAYFGHSVTLLHEGRVVQSGRLSDLMNTPAEPFVTQFINAQRTLYQMESVSE